MTITGRTAADSLLLAEGFGVGEEWDRVGVALVDVGSTDGDVEPESADAVLVGRFGVEVPW